MHTHYPAISTHYIPDFLLRILSCLTYATFWSERGMAKKLLLVDVDCGVDDAQALMMALAAPEVEVLGITCCFGNTTIDHVCKNVLRVLQVCNRMEIPVFRGAPNSLLGEINPQYSHFGGDGLGDVEDPNSPGLEYLQKEDAVHALIRIVNQYEGQINLVALGPLTNLALAVKMDPSLPKKLNKLCIMGGNIEGRGNRTTCAEFNFYLDPEAAYIVINEFTCPMFIAALEFTRENCLTMNFGSADMSPDLEIIESVWDYITIQKDLGKPISPEDLWLALQDICNNLPTKFQHKLCEYFKNWVNQNTEKAKFMKKITAKWPQKHYFVSYDSYAIAAVIEENIITEHVKCAVSVELHGRYARGMLVLDTEDKWKKEHKAFLMKKCNLDRFKALLWNALL